MSSGLAIEAAGLSEAWLAACRALLVRSPHEASHLVVRMSDPLPEDPAIRSGVDDLIAAARHQPVVEVRNTIFPAALAEEFTDPDELITEYLEDYETVRALGSPQGTYFGRICEYPHPDGSVTPQLSSTVAKLNAARTGSRWRRTSSTSTPSTRTSTRSAGSSPVWPTCLSSSAWATAAWTNSTAWRSTATKT